MNKLKYTTGESRCEKCLLGDTGCIGGGKGELSPSEASMASLTADSFNTNTLSKKDALEAINSHSFNIEIVGTESGNISISEAELKFAVECLNARIKTDIMMNDPNNNS